MNLYEFLSHPDVQVPFSWNRTNDFQGFLRKRLKRFVRVLSKLDDGPVADMVRSRSLGVRALTDGISRSVHFSLEGRPDEAYALFVAAIQEVLTELRARKVVLTPGDLSLLYRVRRTTEPILRRKDLFHIPFDQRHKVSMHRYSIPGLPCLYLSGSLYACWEEMGRPPFHELHAAAFWVRTGESVKLLNFSESPSRLRLSSFLKPDGTIDPQTSGLSVRALEARIADSIVLWPLVASASVIVKHRDAPFKPEYLVPQMLLQWVRNDEDFDGVCYFSTNVGGASRRRHLAVCNLVFPAKFIKPSGRCEHLCRLFKMTEPYGWGLLRAVHASGGVPMDAAPFFDMEFIEGVKEEYHETEFGEVELTLGRLATRVMDENERGDPAAGDISPSSSVVDVSCCAPRRGPEKSSLHTVR